MKTPRHWLVVPSAILTGAVISGFTLAITNPALAQTPTIRINPSSQPDPLIIRGTSGGTKSSNCGNIAAKPNQVIQVTQPLPYLQLRVKSPGQPTLLINGPGGRFCVLSDRFSGGYAEISGFWQAGKYSLYVGERSQTQHPYTLSISQQKKSRQ